MNVLPQTEYQSKMCTAFYIVFSFIYHTEATIKSVKDNSSLTHDGNTSSIL